jgi:uncharacterized protein involved in response to NO
VSFTKDPFRIFFPIGAALAIAGVFPWSLYVFGGTGYPVEFHRAIMMNGFMLSFVSGFLMTAVPRFTSTDYAKPLELILVGGSIVLAATLEFLDLVSYHHFFATLALLSLIGFAFRRFRERKSNPPFTFVFVGVGLITWALSNFMIFVSLSKYGVRPGQFSTWADLFSNGALMAIVLGIGGRLIPGILGWQDVVNVQRDKYEKATDFISSVPTLIWISVILFLSSYFIEGFVQPRLALSLRAIVICIFAFRFWRLYRAPKEKSYLTWSIWAAAWCFVVGSLLNIFWTDRYVHSLHTILVGGFSLLTVLVATRVTLAHGSEGRGAEKTSLFIPVFTMLLLFAMVTRVTAVLWPSIYLNHLSYASLTWILGFGLWFWFAIPKMWKSK